MATHIQMGTDTRVLDPEDQPNQPELRGWQLGNQSSFVSPTWGNGEHQPARTHQLPSCFSDDDDQEDNHRVSSQATTCSNSSSYQDEKGYLVDITLGDQEGHETEEILKGLE